MICGSCIHFDLLNVSLFKIMVFVFASQLEIHSPPGTPIGYVIQNWHPFLPKFTIQNEKREGVLKIVGPFCSFRCCSDVNFEV